MFLTCLRDFHRKAKALKKKNQLMSVRSTPFKNIGIYGGTWRASGRKLLGALQYGRQNQSCLVLT